MRSVNDRGKCACANVIEYGSDHEPPSLLKLDTANEDGELHHRTVSVHVNHECKAIAALDGLGDGEGRPRLRQKRHEIRPCPFHRVKPDRGGCALPLQDTLLEIHHPARRHLPQ